jgi:hypothetical protein
LRRRILKKSGGLAESLGWQPTAAATSAGWSTPGGFSSGKTPPLRRQQQQLVGDDADAYGLSSSKQELWLPAEIRSSIRSPPLKI